MYKRCFVCIFALILIFTACSNESGQPRAAAAATKTPQAEPAASSINAYIYYTTGEGLMRSYVDGRESALLERGAYIRLIGNSGGYIYFTDRDGMLYKADENGETKTVLSASPVTDAALAGAALFFIQSNEICRVNSDGSITRLMQIPESILQQPYNLRTDGSDLYICTYNEQGAGSIYACDPESGSVTLQLKDVRYSPLAMYKGCAFQAQVTDTGSRIFKQYINSGETETILDVKGLLYDMSVCSGWLIYIARQENENQTYVNGFNLTSGMIFSLESPCDYICQTLPSGVLLLDSGGNTISMLKITGDSACILSLST